jgi:folate-dependent phosphoribosylglycinamide formyltransferase PurN
MYSIGWFSTGRDKAARDLIKAVVAAIDSGEIKAKINFVFCSRELGESLESDAFINLVKSYGLHLVCFSYLGFKNKLREGVSSKSALPSWRLDYDREVMARLGALDPELCLLAGYMLVVGPEMCKRYTMINLHPAMPGGPAGTWQEVIWKLIEKKAVETGVMMHLVTPELDRGPVVTYCRFSIRGNGFDSLWSRTNGINVSVLKQTEGEKSSLFKLIREQGLKREFPLIISTVKAFSERRVKVQSGKVVDALGNIIPGCDLTQEINSLFSKT